MDRFYARAADCKSLKADSDALTPYIFPLLNEFALDRSGELLRINYRHKSYILGIASNGVLQGFRKRPADLRAIADLCICKTSPFSFRIFERRFHTEEQVCAELEPAGTPNGRLEGGGVQLRVFRLFREHERICAQAGTILAQRPRARAHHAANAVRGARAMGGVSGV